MSCQPRKSQGMAPRPFGDSGVTGAGRVERRSSELLERAGLSGQRYLRISSDRHCEDEALSRAASFTVASKMDLRVRLLGTAASGRGILKHGEPHDRLQGAINLQGDARSKPLKPGGTARAEQM